MQRLGNDEKMEVQVLCAEILDNVEILTNLIYLVRDGHSTGAEKEKYLKITSEKVDELCQIVRKHC